MAAAILSLLAIILGSQAGTPDSQIGRASVDGIVARTNTQQGIQGVTVTLFQGLGAVQRPSVLPPELQFRGVGGPTAPQSAAQVSRPQITVLTDSQGRFEFRDVPAGNYRLVASSNGYVVEEGFPLTMRASVPIRNIRLDLTPLTSITGRVFKDRTPLTGATVVLLRTFFSAEGERRVEEVARTTVDLRGDYWFSTVAPRTYYVATYLMGPRSASDHSVLEVPLTFYPGVLDRRDATEVVVKAIPITLGDIAVSNSTARKIGGKLTDNRGTPPDEASFEVICWLPTSTRIAVFAEQRYDPASGIFELSGLTACSYQIRATGRFKTLEAGKASFTTGAMVDVLHRSVDDLRLVEPVSQSISGRLRFAGPSSAADAQNLARVRVEFETNLRQGAMLLLPPMRSNVAGTDHTLNFSTTDQLGVGDYRLILRYLPENYYVRRVLVNGTDASTQSLQFSTLVPNTVEIFVSTAGGKVSGTVLENQRVLPGVPVVLAPRATLESGTYKTTRADANGQFVFQGISPGQYLLLASDNSDVSSFFDADLNYSLLQRGRLVTVSEGSVVNVQINAVRIIDK